MFAFYISCTVLSQYFYSQQVDFGPQVEESYAFVISCAVFGQALLFSASGLRKFFPLKSVKLVHFRMLSLGT